ncbi:MAG: hypothetical protein ACKVS9_04010 [Phycisphaerae bacterium]
MTPYECYWFPEYRYFSSDAEVQQALAAIGAEKSMYRCAAMAAFVVAPLIVATMLPLARLLQSFRLPPVIGHFALTLLGVLGLIAVILSPWSYWHTRRALRHYLADRGVAICVSCGYDLRGLDEARCSECFAAAEHLDWNDEVS